MICAKGGQVLLSDVWHVLPCVEAVNAKTDHPQGVFSCIACLESLPPENAAPQSGALWWSVRNTIMSTGTSRIMDEFAKLMTDAAGAAQGVRKEAETALHAQAERWLNSLDVVRREEFDVVREMALKALEENEALKARIEALEAQAGATAIPDSTH